MVDLVVGARRIDRRLSAVEHLLAAYRTDDGLRYLDWRPSTAPNRLMPEDLAVTILINSRVGPAAFKSAQDHGAQLDLAELPDVPLEETSVDTRAQVARLIATWRDGTGSPPLWPPRFSTRSGPGSSPSWTIKQSSAHT